MHLKYFIKKSALTTEIFCIIVTSSVNFEGNISGERKYSHANNSCTEQETERCLITNELTHFNLPWTITPKKCHLEKNPIRLFTVSIFSVLWIIQHYS